MVSYEVSIGFVFITVLLCAGSLNLSAIVEAQAGRWGLFNWFWLPPFKVAPFTWLPGIFWFVLKTFLVFFMFALVKAFVPRYRYDQLMRLGWKVFLPISLAAVAVVGAVLQVAGLAAR